MGELVFQGFPMDRASLVAQLVKNLLAMQKTLVRFLGLEDLLEKVMATHSSILAWVTKSGTRLSNFHFLFFFHAFI